MAQQEQVPILTGERVIVRPFRATDTDAVFEAISESIPQLQPWLPWCHSNYSRADSEWWVQSRPQAWRQQDEFSFAVIVRGTGLFLGGCGLNRIDNDNRCCDLGYWIRSSRARQGFATEAGLLVARYAFDTLRMHRITIAMSVENIPSRRVAERIGAKREGRLRNRLFLHGRIHDAFSYSIIPGDLGINNTFNRTG